MEKIKHFISGPWDMDSKKFGMNYENYENILVC